MIRHTFVHLQGVGEATERRLWAEGLVDWATARGARLPGRLASLPDRLAACEEALAEGDFRPFAGICHGRHAWRWYPELRQRAVYLDLETTGGPPGPEAITVIGCWDGREARTFVRDVNLHEFPLYVGDYDLLVTYNGASFDVPFLRAHWRGLRLPPVHLDLRYPLRALGLGGGLKAIEQTTGLARDDGLSGVDGWTAVLLWQRHRRGDPRAAPTLTRYCVEDVLGLEPLAHLAYSRLAATCPVPAPRLETPRRPPCDLPYSLDLLAELQTGR